MNDDSILGSTLGQLGKTAKQAVKQVVKIPEEMAQDVGGQVGTVKQGEEKPKEDKPQGKWPSDDERIKYLRDLYGSIEPSAESSTSAKASTDKPDEQKRLMELRQQLHKQVYYDPTFNPVKKQEERSAEKVEKEKKMEALELQKKEEKKPQPLAVVREQNKAEQFRGAAG